MKLQRKVALITGADCGIGSYPGSLSRDLAEDCSSVNNLAPGSIEMPIMQEPLDNPKKAEKSMADFP